MNVVNPYKFMDELSKLSEDGDIIITDAGATLCWTMQGFKIRKKVRLFSAFNHSPMGYALPASIGAQIASPKSRVFCIIGDGGMQMNVQELETIAYKKLPIKIFMLNNRGYGMIKQTQDTWLEGRHSGVDEKSGLGFPDMVKVARAYGIKGVRISNILALASHKEKLSSLKPAFFDVSIHPDEIITPKLVFGKKLEEIE